MSTFHVEYTIMLDYQLSIIQDCLSFPVLLYCIVEYDNGTVCYMNLKASLACELARVAGISPDIALDAIETPPNPELGDFAFPCFRLAKSLRKAPASIAAELSAALSLPDGFEKAVAAGPYINFFVNKAANAKNVLESVLREGARYGGRDIGRGRNVCIDFSSINIAKPFHIGHLRSTVIGNALYRIYEHEGYNCVGINHLGDWGTQFGKMIYAFLHWGSREEVEREGVSALVKLYVRFHEEAERDPSLDDEARKWFKRMEDGDEEALSLYRWMKELTLAEANRVYERLDIHFDSYAGESFYNDKMDRVITELDEKGLLKLDQGARIVDLGEYKMPPCIILRADGATLYATRDIAAALYRKDTYDFAKSLYVVAYQQDLHFRQWFKVVELMGYDWAKDLHHVNFGMVSVKDGTLSTRHGKVIYLADVLKKAVEKTAEVMAEKSPELTNRDEVAEQVGIGAVIWNGLYNGRIKDIVFDWDTVLNFDGETGPYAQYTYARACSVLRKAVPEGEIDFTKLTDASASAVIAAIAAFPDAVEEAMNKNEPYLVSRAVIEICAAFNRFYYDAHILDEDAATRNARLYLTKCAASVIKTGLGLVGLKAPERM